MVPKLSWDHEVMGLKPLTNSWDHPKGYLLIILWCVWYEGLRTSEEIGRNSKSSRQLGKKKKIPHPNATLAF